MYYHNPTITPSTDPPTSTATVTHATTDCDKTENTSTTEHFQMPYSNVNEIRTNSSTSITPIITGHVTITRMETRTSNIVIIVVSLVVLVVLGVALLIICLLVPRVRHSKHTKQVSCNNNVKTQLEFCDSTSQESNHLPSHSTHMYDTTTSDATSTAPDDSTSQILSSSESDLESGFFNAEEVVQASSVCSPATKHSPSNDSQSQKKSHTVLLIYSPNTTEREQELIHILMAELQLYRIKVLSHDLTSIQGSTSAWLEREAKKASVVLCICNKEFKEDWEGQSEASLPLIQSLKHLIHGTAQNIDESLSKYAVVLLELSHRQYIPTMYLQSDSRQFTMPDTRAIAQYVKNIPSYELSRQSAMAAISDSV